MDEANRKGRTRSLVILAVRSALGLLDHATTFAVLAVLLRQGHVWSCTVGLALSLLPGLVTAFQVGRLSYPNWKLVALLFHPANFYVHSAVDAWKQRRSGAAVQSFSSRVAKVSSTAHELLEAPLQLVFTLSLILKG